MITTVCSWYCFVRRKSSTRCNRDAENSGEILSTWYCKSNEKLLPSLDGTALCQHRYNFAMKKSSKSCNWVKGSETTPLSMGDVLRWSSTHNQTFSAKRFSGMAWIQHEPGGFWFPSVLNGNCSTPVRKAHTGQLLHCSTVHEENSPYSSSVLIKTFSFPRMDCLADRKWWSLSVNVYGNELLLE